MVVVLKIFLNWSNHVLKGLYSRTIFYMIYPSLWSLAGFPPECSARPHFLVSLACGVALCQSSAQGNMAEVTHVTCSPSSK